MRIGLLQETEGEDMAFEQLKEGLREPQVVLLGRQGEDCIDADEMASWLDTISYEVLCSPSARVPRVYIHE